MTGTISGRTVVVVGGSRGIGLEVGMAWAWLRGPAADSNQNTSLSAFRLSHMKLGLSMLLGVPLSGWRGCWSRATLWLPLRATRQRSG